MSKLIIKKTSTIAKSNRLNELRPNELKLQELRFFNIYLSKINPMDENSRLVRFSVADFQAIMELGSRVKIEHIRKTTEGLLRKIVTIWDENTGGYSQFQIFKKCKVNQDDFGQWFVEIDVHDDALPLMFNLKSHYFRYELWNTLSLKSHNQLRIYEILKQYEKIGYRIIQIGELREMLGIGKEEYPRYNNFKLKVIEPCQKALAEKTDISFTYEVHKRDGRGGKISELKFIITKNPNYRNPINLEKFIGLTNDYENAPKAEGAKAPKTKIDTSKATMKIDTSSGTVNLINLTEEEHMGNFDKFWMAYPAHKQSGKRLAMLEWLGLPCSHELFAEIMAGLERAKNSQKWADEDGKFVHEPANWLKQERWKDNYRAVAKVKDKVNKNRFLNYKGRVWDYDELARKESELLNKKINQGS